MYLVRAVMDGGDGTGYTAEALVTRQMQAVGGTQRDGPTCFLKVNVDI